MRLETASAPPGAKVVVRDAVVPRREPHGGMELALLHRQDAGLVCLVPPRRQARLPGRARTIGKSTPTHGICASHKEQVLESLPSQSFPDAELLIVVCRNYIPLYKQLLQWFVSVPGVKVLVDRRATDRRSATYSVTDERRARTRRLRRGTISPEGSYTVVRFTPKVIHSPRPQE